MAKQRSHVLDPAEWVFVKVEAVLGSTAKACLFEAGGEEVWVPFSQMRFAGRDKIIAVRQWIADEKSFALAEEFHHPEPIQPQFGQEAIDALRY